MLWTLDNVTLSGRVRPRLDRVSVSIPSGRVAVVGASGSGKTSLLNLLVGFESTQGLKPGETRNPKSETRSPESNFPTGAISSFEFRASNFSQPSTFWSPPDFGLWPHLTVREHLAAVEPTGDPARVDRLLSGFGLLALGDAYPASLSQGECSRLSVARAVAARPQVLVLDEPLEHVDTALRDQCWQVLRDEIQATGTSLVFSTHSPERVLSEAEWCLCLDAGQLVWAGPVEELYERPASPEQARFLGPCNWIEERLEVRGERLEAGGGPRGEGLGPGASTEEVYGQADDRAVTAATLTPSPSPGGRGGPEETGSVTLSSSVPPCLRGESDHGRANGPVPRPVRPERLQLVTDDSGPFEVIAERFSGSLAEVEITQLATGVTQRVYHRPPRPALKPGQRVSLRILATILAVLTCLWQSGCDVLGVPELKVLASESVRIPVDGKRMPAPRALTISPEKELYCLDDSGRILVYSPENELVRQWRMPESDVGKPEGIRILQDGRVAIADTHYHRVVFFNKQGDLLGMFGSKGEKPGEFTYPVDLLQDPQGFLYVAEYGGSDRIQKFAPDGQFVLEFGGLGTEVGKFQRPSGMVWIDSKIYVADAINSRVQVFSDQGEPLEVLDWARQGGLYYPYDISLNPQGQIFMVEYGACRLTVAEPHGSIIAQYGQEGRGHNELWTPWALTVSEDNRVFIADTGNRRIVQLTLPGGRL